MARLNFPSIDAPPKFNDLGEVEEYLEELINQIYSQFEDVSEELNYGHKAEIELLTDDPEGLVAGDQGKIWFNTTDKKYKGWNGTEVVLLG
jgi:hypothetical protein